jgi:hypothetical protein
MGETWNFPILKRGTDLCDQFLEKPRFGTWSPFGDFVTWMFLIFGTFMHRPIQLGSLSQKKIQLGSWTPK